MNCVVEYVSVEDLKRGRPLFIYQLQLAGFRGKQIDDASQEKRGGSEISEKSQLEGIFDWIFCFSPWDAANVVRLHLWMREPQTRTSLCVGPSPDCAPTLHVECGEPRFCVWSAVWQILAMESYGCGIAPCIPSSKALVRRVKAVLTLPVRTGPKPQGLFLEWTPAS